MKLDHVPQTKLGRDVFTTGQVARICGCASRTATKWIDAGKLKARRLPGSPDRRVDREVLLAFAREHEMKEAVAFLEAQAAEKETVRLHTGRTTDACPLAAGAMLQRGLVGRVVVGCAAGLGEACRLARSAREVADPLTVELLLSADRSPEDVPEGIFDAVTQTLEG